MQATPNLYRSVALASFESHGEIVVRQGEEEHFFSDKLYCPDCNISIREPQPATFSLNSPAAVCPHCHGRGCASCGGSGFNRWALSFYFRDKTIFQAGEMEIADLLEFFRAVTLTGDEAVVLAPILPQIVQRLESFAKLNLGYMTLNRKMPVPRKDFEKRVENGLYEIVGDYEMEEDK